MAWPDFDRRATMTTGPALESFLDGIGLVESSSWNVKGKSFLVARTIDTGIGGPLISRANTNNVSVGDPLPARLGATVTVPLIVRGCSTCPVVGWAGVADSAYGLSRSMTTVSPSTPDCTGRLVPSKSPLCGMAWPDFDRRATMTTGPALEMFLDGIGLVESSSWNVKGKSFLVARTIATGIRGPPISRANTNKVSVGDPLPTKFGATVTVPLIVRGCPVCPVG